MGIEFKAQNTVPCILFLGISSVIGWKAEATEISAEPIDLDSLAVSAPELPLIVPPLETTDFLLTSAPENFNPELREPEPVVPLSPPETAPAQPFRVDSLTTDFRNTWNNFDERNLFIEPNLRFQLPNGNHALFGTGFNQFSQPDVESITNIPLRVGWEGEFGRTQVDLVGGVDIFDRLPTAVNFRARVERTLFIDFGPEWQFESGLFLAGEVEQGPYKFNARTLDNQITALRLGPNLFWQIDPNTSFFSNFRYGNYNDGNQEIQSFSRFERRLGQFSVAANLFTWRYDRDVQDEIGYFSPPDFLVYNGELAWEGNIAEFLRCRLAGSLGQQRLRGVFDVASSFETRCTTRVSPNVEFDLGYTISNVRNQDPGDDGYTGNTLAGQLRINF